MRFILASAPFFAVTLGVAAQAASAPKPIRYEVLGIHVGQEMSKAESILGQRSFLAGQKGMFDGQCYSSLQSFLAAMAKRGKTGVVSSDGKCQRNFSKANSDVSVFYVMGPQGYVVSQVIYSFPTANKEQIVAELSSKFGSPKTHSDGVSWSTSPATNPFKHDRLSYSQSRTGDMLSLSAGYDRTAAIARETSAVLLKQAGSSKPEL